MSKERVAEERALIVEAEGKGALATGMAYMKLSGPGWLQSAITLGGGSLASSLYLGVLAGVSMLWLQPLAMIFGIIMLSAISYVTLSTGERPFRAINQHISPIAGWSWLLASLLANMVWALPQYSLFYGVMEHNLLPGLLGSGGALEGETGKWVVSGVVLAISTAIVWGYGSGGWGVKIYEWVLKGVVAMIVLCFVGVVVRMAFSENGLQWGQVIGGFIPDLRQLYEPAPAFQIIIEKLQSAQAREYWTGFIVSQQRDVMISAAATAVGINMTFLLPYSLLSRGWDKSFRGLATFDLCTGMFIPFVLATSAVIIASATQFHAVLPTGVEAHGNHFHGVTEPIQKNLDKAIAARNESVEAPVTAAEQGLAMMLIKRNANALATSLQPLTGSTVSNLVFGIGVAGMALSTISLLMLISGFVVCEIRDVPQTGWTLRLGCLLAATGALWPLVWTGDAKFWLAIVTSVFGITLLPIAYITFYLMMNRTSILGKDRPKGVAAIGWNVSMGVAAAAATCASLYVIWSKLGTVIAKFVST
ncbi:MAG TPA: hypothetical protein EYQ75_13280 [Planctomycetaceae bacterium]|nr:hypothetical protein [Planctomycetaceae bacterium]